jgi:hypothetical protein
VRREVKREEKQRRIFRRRRRPRLRRGNLSRRRHHVWPTVEQAAKICTKCVSKKIPNKKSAQIYKRQYAIYDKLYGDLKDRFAEMAGAS